MSHTKRIIFIGMPAAGHINPTLPVVRELVRRGNKVTYYATEEFRARIEQSGATYHSYPLDTISPEAIARATESGDATRVPRIILEATKTLLPFTEMAVQNLQPDVIVLDSNALWGHMAAKKLHLPTISLMTTFMISFSQLKQLRITEWLHLFLPAIRGFMGTAKVRSQVLRQFGKELYPPNPTFPIRGALNIAFFPKSLQVPNSHITKSFRYVGTTLSNKEKEIVPPDFPLHTLGRNPVIYISLGTLHAGSKDFFRQCFTAFADMPVQCVLSAGKQTDIARLGEIPANFIVRQSVPQLTILKKASVFITHGGMNSTLEALYYGVPLIFIPQQIEQLLISLAIAKRDAGLVLRENAAGKHVTADILKEALTRLLAESQFQNSARQMSSELRRADGYRKAADEIDLFYQRGHA
jgi:MGT family glycosyltransferase